MMLMGVAGVKTAAPGGAMSNLDHQTMSYDEIVERIRNEILPLFDEVISGRHAFYRNPNLSACWDAIDDEPCRCLHMNEKPEKPGYLDEVSLVDQFNGEALRPRESCVRCPVYKDACPSVVEELGEAFNNMVHILSQKDDALHDAVTLTRELASSLQDMDIENMTIRERMVTDSLTGLFNRTHLNDCIVREVERCHNRRRSLSVLMIDLDNFKIFNDTYGHLEGDKVLSRLGRHLKSCLRDYDQAFRYGGEEFLVILPDADNEGARVVADRIRSGFADLVFDIGGPANMPATLASLTLSGGLVTYRNGMGAVELLEAADQALYAAKRHGKNRIEIYDETLVFN